MDTPERNQGLKPLRTLYVCGRNVICVSALITGLAITGCSDSGPSTQSGIYGVYEGTSADYTHGGAAAPVVDNGFTVDDGVKPRTSASTPTSGPAGKTTSNSDTLVGKKGGDTLTGAPSSLDSSGDPLGSGKDALDPDDNTPKNQTDNGQNYYSYWIRGQAVNCTMKVLINGAEVPLVQGHVDDEVSDMVHPGINKVDFMYTPLDSTSSALITIRKGTPDLPDSVRFDSNTYALSQTDDAPSAAPASITKTSYFLAD